MRVEQQLVDLVVEKIGEQTLNGMCQPGVRERLAKELAGPIDQILSEWVKRYNLVQLGDDGYSTSKFKP